MVTPLERHRAFFSGQETDRPLVQPLLMLLASRRAGLAYRDYVTDGSLLARAQLKAAEEAGLDLLSSCSDPVREVCDLGGGVVGFDDEPPMPDPSSPLLADSGALARLKAPDPRESPRMKDRIEGIREMKALGEGRYPVLGWVEGPSSLAAGLCEISVFMERLLDEPEFIEDLMDFCTRLATDFALAQIEAGADMIGMGDAPSSLIGPDLYREHVLPGEAAIIGAIHEAGALARLHICGNTTRLASLMGQSGADLVDFDYPVDFARACQDCPQPRGILGNLDPVRAVKSSTPPAIVADLRACSEAAGGRYVAGAGCEIPAGTPDENLLAFHHFAAGTSLS